MCKASFTNDEKPDVKVLKAAAEPWTGRKDVRHFAADFLVVFVLLPKLLPPISVFKRGREFEL